MVVVIVDSDRFGFSRSKFPSSIDVIHKARLFQSRCVLFGLIRIEFPFLFLYPTLSFCGSTYIKVSCIFPIFVFVALYSRFALRWKSLRNKNQQPIVFLCFLFLVVVFLLICGSCSFSSLSRLFSIWWR